MFLWDLHRANQSSRSHQLATVHCWEGEDFVVCCHCVSFWLHSPRWSNVSTLVTFYHICVDRKKNELYHHSKSVSLQQLPPTSSATRLHILRAVYATNEMVSLLSTTHDRLDPTQYGFEEVDDLLTPQMDANPISEKFATHCNCLKCGIQRCPCLRNAEPCCSFCRCQSGLVAECKNVFGKT